MPLKRHPSRDLFRRPTNIKTVTYRSHDLRILDQLAMHSTAVFVGVLGIHSVIPVQLWTLVIAIEVPLDLAVDCRGRTMQIVSNLLDRYLRLKSLNQRAAFVEVQVRVAAPH